MKRVFALAVVPLLFLGCATGPRRAALVESGAAKEADAEKPAATSPPPTPALPFSPGVLIGVSVGSKVAPVNLVTGNLKVTELAGRALGVSVVAGVEGESFSAVKPSGGVGVYYELTGGDLRYEAGATVGGLWKKNAEGATEGRVLLGFTFLWKL